MTSDNWHRSSAWALLPHTIQAIQQFMAVVLGGAYISFSKRELPYLPYLITGIILLIAVRAIIRWRFTLFRVGTDGIELRQGFLQKERLLLPWTRVQELSVQQPFYFRPLALYAVALDSSGSQKQEFQLTGLSQAQVRLLQGEDFKQAAQSSTPFGRIWLATLYNKHIWLPLFALTGVGFSSFDGKGYSRAWGLVKQQLAALDITHHSLGWQLGLLALFMAAVSGVLALVAFIWFYPQHFTQHESQLRLTHGSLVKASKRIWQSRLQLVTVNQPWLARLFGHYSLIFNGFANTKQKRSKFVVLGQTVTDIDAQLQANHWQSLTGLQQQTLTKFMPAYFRRIALWGSAVMLGLLAMLYQTQFLQEGWRWAMVGVAALWLVADFLLYKRFHGYQLTDDVLYYWRGGVSQYWQVLPLQQIQQVRLTQSRYFKTHQMVKLKLATANGHITLAAIPEQQAKQLYQQVLRLQTKKWAQIKTTAPASS